MICEYSTFKLSFSLIAQMTDVNGRMLDKMFFALFARRDV
jgi:hypothetical protein